MLGEKIIQSVFWRIALTGCIHGLSAQGFNGADCISAFFDDIKHAQRVHSQQQRPVLVFHIWIVVKVCNQVQRNRSDIDLTAAEQRHEFIGCGIYAVGRQKSSHAHRGRPAQRGYARGDCIFSKSRKYGKNEEAYK